MPERRTDKPPADTALQLLTEGLQCLRSADTAHSAARNRNAVTTHDGDTLTALPAVVYGDQMQRAGVGYLIAALVQTQLDGAQLDGAQPDLRIADAADVDGTNIRDHIAKIRAIYGMDPADESEPADESTDTVSTGDMFMDDVIQALIHQNPEWGENDRAKVWDNGRAFVARYGPQAQTVAQEYWGL